MYQCDKCHKEFTKKGSLSNHLKACYKVIQKNLYICEKCGFEIKSSRKKHYDSCDGKGPRSKRLKEYKEKRIGKTYVEMYGLERSIEIKKVLSEKGKGSKGVALTPEKEQHRREKIRNSINDRYKNGWDAVCGRCKKYDYVSKIAGDIKVDGLWEYKVAEYLDSINVNWRRPTERFSYTNPSGGKSTYKPDFFVIDWNSYIEVKGYETDLDRCKWSQFPNKLIVWKKKDLIRLGILESNP